MKSVRACGGCGYFCADTLRVAVVAMRFLSFLTLFGMLMFIQKTRKGQEKDMKRNKKSKKWGSYAKENLL